MATMAARLNCPMCNTDIPLVVLFAHFPKCYRLFCQTNGVEPFCTCNLCEGARTHPLSRTLPPSQEQAPVETTSDILSDFDLLSPLAPLSPCSPLSSINSSSSSSAPPAVKMASLSPPVALSTSSASVGARHIDGTVCCVCGKPKSPSSLTVPIIHIGAYRKLKICKKTHLAEPAQRLAIETLINSQLQVIRVAGDQPLRGLPNDEAMAMADQSCRGFEHGGEGKQCPERGELIWIRDGEVKFFCSAAHVTHFLLSFYCKKGRKVEKQTEEKPSLKKRKVAKEEEDAVYVSHLCALSDDDFEELVGLPKRSVAKLISTYRQHTQSQIGRPPKFGPHTEILLILLYLRQYPVDCFMASIFMICKSTYAAIRQRMLDYLFNLLAPELIFPSFEYRWAHRRESWLPGIYYTWVVDGSEQPFTGCGQDDIDTLLYSSKKDQHSVTVLLWIAMNGRIMFLSNSYGGGTNDLEIAVQEVYRYNQFTAIEQGMGDSGFAGLSQYGVGIDCSPASARGSPESRAFSSLRIKVENAIAKIKDFRACKEQIRGSPHDLPAVLCQHNKIWTIVAVFVNDYK